MTIREVFIAAALATFVSACGLAGYDRFVRRPQTPRFGVLDIGDIYTQKTREMLNATSASNTLDSRRQAAVGVEVDKFNDAAVSVVRDLSRECACVLLARPAVVEGVQLPDYTEAARKRLGL